VAVWTGAAFGAEGFEEEELEPEVCDHATTAVARQAVTRSLIFMDIAILSISGAFIFHPYRFKKIRASGGGDT